MVLDVEGSEEVEAVVMVVGLGDWVGRVLGDWVGRVWVETGVGSDALTAILVLHINNLWCWIQNYK
jgi:hypothetical protein